MNGGRRGLAFVALVLLSTMLAFAQEELPLGRCDRLPVVTVRIGTSHFQFLVDTGATSILNLKSFSAGTAKDIHVSSWQGTAATSAREVSIPDLMLGNHRLRNLKLPAIYLSPIANACGGAIDGILGIDLLEQMGVTLDLRRRIARLGLEPQDAQAKYAEMELAMGFCHQAFNDGKAQELEACFDPDIILYNKWGEYRGRKQVMAYLQENFLRYAPNLRFNLRPHDVQIFGEALWYSYDYSIALPERKVVGQGVAVCRKTDGRWRMLNMHNSVISPETLPPSSHAKR